MTGRGSREPEWPTLEPACSELRIDSTLVNVDLAVAADATTGESLPVRLMEDKYPAVFRNGKALGAITSNRPGALVKCLRDGEQFVALLLDVDGHLINVRVTHA